MITWGVVIISALSLGQPTDDRIPKPEDVRFQTIRKVEGRKDWPFVDKEGRLSCVELLGQKMVYFLPISAGKRKGEVVLDVNPISLVLLSIGRKDVLLPASSPVELIRRIAPFVAMGQMLCKQNKGPMIPGGEL